MFGEKIATDEIRALRSKILDHALWKRIEDGTLELSKLRLFALQDWWLVREAYRLDAISVARTDDPEVQELLLSKLIPKIGGYKHLIRFGEALGLSRADFENVAPLAGCMALTNFFFWILSCGTLGERLAGVGASEDIFVQICARVRPSLRRNYGLSAADVEFFTIHDEIGGSLSPIDNLLLSRFEKMPEERPLIIRALRLSLEYELMFYDTVMNSRQ